MKLCGPPGCGPGVGMDGGLADLAGKVTVTVKAEKADGLDKAKLQNGVMEPLREADLIK